MDQSRALRLAGSRRLAWRAAAAGTVLAYSWWVTTFRAFTWPMRIATAVPGVVVLLAAWRDQRRQRRRRGSLHAWLSGWRAVLGDSHRSLPVRSKVAWRAGTAVWSLLIAAVAGWEILARLHGPRSEYPTISSMVDSLTQWHGTRFVVFVLWLLFGRDLLRR